MQKINTFIFKDGYIYVQNINCGQKLITDNSSSSTWKEYTFESCKNACSNDIECAAFTFTKAHLPGTTWCIRYSKDECVVTEYEGWDLFIKEIGISMLMSPNDYSLIYFR